MDLLTSVPTFYATNPHFENRNGGWFWEFVLRVFPGRLVSAFIALSFRFPDAPLLPGCLTGYMLMAILAI